MEKRLIGLKIFHWGILFVLISEHVQLLPSVMAENHGPRVPTRRFVACKLPAIKNGKINIRSRGRKIRYKCFKPSTLIGSPVASCIDEKWFPSLPPVCAKTGCGRIDGIQADHGNEIVNGYSENVVSNAFVKFHCHPGHWMRGNKTTFCDGFHWSSPAPSCSSLRKEPNLVIDFDECLTNREYGFAIFI